MAMKKKTQKLVNQKK